jgi:hypothetical protein
MAHGDLDEVRVPERRSDLELGLVGAEGVERRALAAVEAVVVRRY